MYITVGGWQRSTLNKVLAACKFVWFYLHGTV